MKLRKLQLKDAPLMLEWMHDESIISGLQREKFMNKTLQDCEDFIYSCQEDSNNLHLAIVDDDDDYMGTVSLKNITQSDAEFAITVRSIAQGKGFAQFGMKEIIRIGNEEMNLRNIYWCVRRDNPRAIRFYDKNNYKRMDVRRANTFVGGGVYTTIQMENFYWYIAE